MRIEFIGSWSSIRHELWLNRRCLTWSSGKRGLWLDREYLHEGNKIVSIKMFMYLCYAGFDFYFHLETLITEV